MVERLVPFEVRAEGQTLRVDIKSRAYNRVITGRCTHLAKTQTLLRLALPYRG